MSLQIEKHSLNLYACVSQSDNFNIKEKWLASPSFGYHLDGNDWSKTGCFFALGHSDWMQSWLCLFIRQRVRPRSAARLWTIPSHPSSLLVMLQCSAADGIWEKRSWGNPCKFQNMEVTSRHVYYHRMTQYEKDVQILPSAIYFLRQ